MQANNTGDNVNISIVAGRFDSIHPGHADLLHDARRFGQVHVLLAPDNWQESRSKWHYKRRESMLYQMDHVWSVHSIRESITDGIQKVMTAYPDATITFCTGGPEMHESALVPAFCTKHGIKIMYDIGR